LNDMGITTGILLFDDAEELDFAGPWEVLSWAAQHLFPEDRVVTVADDAGAAPGSPRDDWTLVANAKPCQRQASTLLYACEAASSNGYTISEHGSGSSGSEATASARASYS